MRRIVVVLAGLAVISTGLACQHTAGKCDCTPNVAPCNRYGIHGDAGSYQEAPRAETLPAAPPKAMPMK